MVSTELRTRRWSGAEESVRQRRLHRKRWRPTERGQYLSICLFGKRTGRGTYFRINFIVHKVVQKRGGEIASLTKQSIFHFCQSLERCLTWHSVIFSLISGFATRDFRISELAPMNIIKSGLGCRPQTSSLLRKPSITSNL